MKISLYKQRRDEAEEQLVEEWEGEGALSNLGYYIGKYAEPNCSLRIHLGGGKKGSKKLRRIE